MCADLVGRRPASPAPVRALLQVALAVFAVITLWLAAVPDAAATPLARTGVPQCELGAYLSDLYDIAPAKDRFSARLWLWTVCPDRRTDPLPRIAYSNADDPKASDPDVIPQGDHVLDQVRVQSSFRHDWDVRDFPFDHHRIEVLLTPPQDTNHFRFTVDNKDSEVNPEMHTRGWGLTGFRLTAADKHYTTTHGDKTLKHGSAYNRVRIRIDLERSDPTAFWKLTTPLYLAVLIATSTFLVSSHREELTTAERLEGLHSRLGVLGGGLFVAVLNMQQVNTVVTSTVGLTLIDWLHLTTLAFLLLAVAGTVLSWRWTARGGSIARAEQMSHRGAWAGVAAYALTCSMLALLAAWR